MLGYHVPSPDQAMLITGAKGKEGDAPFKIVVGKGAFVMPIVRQVNFLSLSLKESRVEDDCVTQQGIALKVKAVIAFKIGSDVPSIAAAAQRFLESQDQMTILTGQIFAGHLRSIVGSMTVESIIRDRQSLSENVLQASKVEMASLGLAVDSLQIQSIDDLGSGYIKSLAAPHVAAVTQAANIAQAQADQATAEARQASDRAQAEYARETAIARAQFQSEIDQAQAKQNAAGPLAEAQAQQAVIAEQALVAAKNAELREAQLQAEVVKPAEAEAARIRIEAAANAEQITMVAEAAASHGRIALDQQIIAQLPELLRATADSLQGANLTVLNGAEGLNGLVAQLASQGAAVLDTLRQSSREAQADLVP